MIMNELMETCLEIELELYCEHACWSEIGQNASEHADHT